MHACKHARLHTHSHTKEYYSALIKKEILSFAKNKKKDVSAGFYAVRETRYRKTNTHNFTYMWRLLEADCIVVLSRGMGSQKWKNFGKII